MTPKVALVRATVARLVRARRPTMLVSRVFARGGVAIVAAPPYAGKTFFALEAMRAVVYAKPFLGHFPVDRPGNVLYLGNDSPDWDLASQFNKLIGLPNPDLEDVETAIAETPLGGFGFIFDPGFALNTAEDAERVVEAANSSWSGRDYEEYVTPDGEHTRVHRAVRGTDLIVIDTLRSVHGFEENDNTAMQHVMNLLRYIATSTRASVLALHHFNKSSKETREASLERLRGATAIGGAVDSVFALTGKYPSVGVRVLKHRPCPEQGDFMYEFGPGEGTEYSLRVTSAGGVVNAAASDAIVALLSAAEGWVRTADIAAVVKEHAGTDKESAIRASTNRCLTALEKAGTIVRIHGAARLTPKKEVQ